MRRIWIINHHAGHMLEDKGGRHYWMAKYLFELGYQPVIICSNAKHEVSETIIELDGKWDVRRDEEIGTSFVFIKARTYVGNGKGRLLNILDFCGNLMKSYKELCKTFGRPDIILASSIHPLAPVTGIRIARRIGIPCICEFRDLWPDELICMGSISESGMIAKVLRMIEHWSYQRADALIFTMEGATQYIRNQGWNTESGGNIDLEKSHYINNGVDLQAYEDNVKEFEFRDVDLDDEKTFKVVYTGTINLANGIQKILDIAKELENIHQIKFLLYGSGNESENLKRRIQEEHIDNVIYKGMVNKQYIPYILSKSSLNLLNYLNGDLFRYGCSNNKLFEYMASGMPILCTVRMNYSIVKKYKCGMEFSEGETAQMAGFIRDLYEHPEKAEEYKENCKKAIYYFDFANFAKELDQIIAGLLQKAE